MDKRVIHISRIGTKALIMSLGPRFTLHNIPLEPQEIAILLLVMAAKGNPVWLKTIEDALWGDDPDGGPLHMRNAISVRVNSLRRKGFPIKTWTGGYSYAEAS